MSDKSAPDTRRMHFFERYLTVWVALCIIAGTAIGYFWPQSAEVLSRYTYAEISIPVAVLIWLMIYPMMLQVDFSSLRRVGERKQGLIITTVTNWLIKPFTMYVIAWFFFFVVYSAWIEPELATELLAGAVLLGAAPCTAMVFVWSYLTDGDPPYTLVQVALNDIILLFAFAPIVMILLGLSDVIVPYDTVVLSVVLFVVIPLVAGWITRTALIRRKGLDWFENVFLPSLHPVTITALLATLVLIFIFQGQIIVENPVLIALIAVPLLIQTYLIFALSYGWGWLWRVRHPVAAPAGLISASNFFELAVAVSIALFGLASAATLVTVVGVLVEVPVMLSLVYIANRTKGWIDRRAVDGTSA
jgi:ACR3 family arsenite transporter